MDQSNKEPRVSELWRLNISIEKGKKFRIPMDPSSKVSDLLVAVRHRIPNAYVSQTLNAYIKDESGDIALFEDDILENALNDNERDIFILFG